MSVKLCFRLPRGARGPRAINLKNRLSAMCIERRTFPVEAQSSRRRDLFSALRSLRPQRLCGKPFDRQPAPTQMTGNSKNEIAR